MQPSPSDPSGAVVAVSRLLSPAGGASEPEAVRETVVREAARFYGVPAALLLAVDDRDRRARVVAAEGVLVDRDRALDLQELPPIATLIDSDVGELWLGPEDTGALVASLTLGGAQNGEGQLVDLHGDVLLLAGARGWNGGPGPPAATFVTAAAAALERLRTAAVHAEQMERQRALTRAAKTLNESLDLETLLGRICSEAATLLDADHAGVYHGSRAEGLKLAAVWNHPPELVGWRLEEGTGLSGQVLAQDRPMFTNDYGHEIRHAAGSPFTRVRAALAVPFDGGSELRGVLVVGYDRRHRVHEEDLDVLETFAELAAVACRNASAHAGLARAAQTDALTGCLNHAALHQHLEQELDRAVRGAAAPPSLALIDVDHFKRVNDSRGHLVGDEVLRRVGSALRGGVRPRDAAARYGGDEFALVVAGAGEDEAGEIALRAVGRIAAAIAEFVDGETAGATAGVAAWSPGIQPSELIARADRALLYGKQTQRRGRAHPFSLVPEEFNRGRLERDHERGLPAPPLMPLASSAGGATGADDRLRKRTRQLVVANALGARLAGMTDPVEIFEATVEELHNAFGYFLSAVVRLCDDDHVEAVAIRGEAFVRLGLRGWRQHRTAGLIGRCLRTQRPVLVSDVTREADYSPTPETVEVRSELIVPLWVGDHLWGVVNLEDVEPDGFDEDDLRLVETVADQVGAALRSASLYEQLERAYLGTAKALSAALEAKDAYTADHGRSIVEHAEAVGLRLGMDDAALRDMRFAAIFHDIGKIAIPETILSKRGPLTDEERAIMQRHTIMGEQILAPVEFLAGVCKLVRHEHERWDGAGYPDGLAGEQIPLGSRIIFACDALHAMTSDRPYRRALPRERALAELRRNAGTQFDPRVVEALLAVVDPHPPALATR